MKKTSQPVISASGKLKSTGLRPSREMGIAAIHLEVEQENKRAQAFYRSWGFTSRTRFVNMSKRLEQ